MERSHIPRVKQPLLLVRASFLATVGFHARPRSFEEGENSRPSTRALHTYIYIYAYQGLGSAPRWWTLRSRLSSRLHSRSHARHTSSLPLPPTYLPPSPPPLLVLYNATIDSRPLFHARDLLQSLQPVSGDSVQCPVSLPVSVRKIYFPMRYTGWLGENSPRSVSSPPAHPAPHPLPSVHPSPRDSLTASREKCFFFGNKEVFSCCDTTCDDHTTCIDTTETSIVEECGEGTFRISYSWIRSGT